MTIEFNCPNCDAVIAFADKHRGKRAHCTTCGQGFVIPLISGEKAKKTKPPKEKTEPLDGFYRAAFIDSWKLFSSDEQNVTGLVFIAITVCFKFFVARMNYTIVIPGQSLIMEFPLPIGHVLTIAAWGFLFWYYMEIIYTTAFDAEKLPEVIVEGVHGFFGRIVKSVYTMFIILLVTELPYVIAYIIAKKTGHEWPVLTNVLMFSGLFLFPMAILTVGVGRDLTMLRPDYLLVPIFKVFKPYFSVAVLFAATALIQIKAKQYTGAAPAITALHLTLNLVVHMIAVIAMRSTGLLHRHYGCYFPW